MLFSWGISLDDKEVKEEKTEHKDEKKEKKLDNPKSEESSDYNEPEQVITFVEPIEIDPQLWSDAFLEWIKKHNKRIQE